MAPPSRVNAPGARFLEADRWLMVADRVELSARLPRLHGAVSKEKTYG